MKELAFQYGSNTWHLGKTPLIMGVVNMTPDSFSDGGELNDRTEEAVRTCLRMEAAGAAIIDIGGESTRPGAAAVSADEEQRRILPLIRTVAPRLSVPVSIDTQKAAVAESALKAGAQIVNDVSGFHRDPAMMGVVRTHSAGGIVMHMRGTPKTMQHHTEYADLVEEIYAYLADILARAAAAEIAEEHIIVDPGIGFGKTAEQNLALIGSLHRFRELGRPVLVGPSRKSFIGKLLSIEDPQQRIWGTAGAVAASVVYGADIIRVHDVAEMREVSNVAAAIREAAESAERC